MKTQIRNESGGQTAGFSRNLRHAGAAALALLFFSPVAKQPAGAQIFPPQGDDTTPSMGVFRIVVDPLFRPLLAPTGPPTSFAGYTGFHSSDGRLTSPMLIDPTTTIGRSNPNFWPTPFPQPLGAGSWDTIAGYSDYPVILPAWTGAPNASEVLTEIKIFVLQTVGGSTGNGGCANPLVPTAPPGYAMVKAGTFAGVSPRSLGIVREDGPPGPPDFPARSFFDIFVEINLPMLPGTESSVAFPAAGAILTNVQPLIVTNLNLTSFPPQVVYIHGGNTNAVQLRFKYSNPPYWTGGDLLGTLVLAGHGTFTNDCTQEAALAAAVLGTTNDPMPGMPTEWLRTNTLVPSPGSTYQSLLTDTNPPGGSDTLTYTLGTGGAWYLRDFICSNLVNYLQPPPYFGTNYYNPTNVMIFCQASLDNVNFLPAQAGGSMSVTMSNTTSSGGTVSTFDTRITQMSLTGFSQFGSLMLRQSASKPSLGKHAIRPDTRGYRVSSFFDVFTELSTDGGSTWMAADRSIRMEASASPAAPGSLFVSKSNSVATLQWLGPFTLQSSTNVSGAYSDVSGSTGGSLRNSWSVTSSPNLRFFRLRQ